MFDFTSDRELSTADGWFVYLLTMTDCTGFKVGFTCNPLRRVYAFNRRYFEVIDLDESVLLHVPTIAHAREFEARVKNSFAPHRIAAPSWLAPQAGGHTEWFSAVYFREAIGLLEECASSECSCALTDLRSQLARVLLTHREHFERWLMEEMQYIDTLARSAKTLPLARERRLRLHDWWDAYQRLGVDVFLDRPEIRAALIHHLLGT